jgi:hypothetical protein
VFNATFSNISATPVLLEEEAGEPPTMGKQLVIQIHPCLLLSCKQENVTDGRPLLLYPPPLSRGIKKGEILVFG